MCLKLLTYIQDSQASASFPLLLVFYLWSQIRIRSRLFRLEGCHSSLCWRAYPQTGLFLLQWMRSRASRHHPRPSSTRKPAKALQNLDPLYSVDCNPTFHRHLQLFRNSTNARLLILHEIPISNLHWWYKVDYTYAGFTVSFLARNAVYIKRQSRIRSRSEKSQLLILWYIPHAIKSPKNSYSAYTCKPYNWP